MKKALTIFTVAIAIGLVFAANAIAVTMTGSPFGQTYGQLHALGLSNGSCVTVVGDAACMAIMDAAQANGSQVTVTGETDGILFYAETVAPATGTATKEYDPYLPYTGK